MYLNDAQIGKPQTIYMAATATVEAYTTEGMIGYDTTTDKFGFRNASAWQWMTPADYVLLAGRSGGQTVYGGTASGDDLTLNSTSHGTKGYVLIGTGGDIVGMSTTSPTSTVGGLDISSGGIGLVIGADSNAITRTADTQKNARMGFAHYHNTEEPFACFIATSSSTANTLTFGGGTSLLNAATALYFYTAADHSTTTGSQRMMIDSSGMVGVGASAVANYHVFISKTDWDNSANQSGLYLAQTATAAGTSKALYGLNFIVTATNSSGSFYKEVGVYGKASAAATSPAYVLNVHGAEIQSYQSGTGMTDRLVGIYSVTEQEAGMGNVNWMRHHLVQMTVNASVTATGFTSGYGNVDGTYYDLDVGSSGSITGTYHAIYIRDPDVASGGYIGNIIAIEVRDITDGITLNEAIRTNAGSVVFNYGGHLDADFTWKSDTATMIFGDAGNEYVYLGGTTNGIRVAKDGDLTLLGTAKYERHIQIDAKADGTVANQPTPVDFYTVGGIQYPSVGAKYAYCQWEVPDDWDGTDVYFEIDWFPDSGATSGTDAVRWTVEYRAIAEGEAVNNGSSVTLSNGSAGDINDYTQYQVKHTRVTLVYNDANQPLTKQDHVFFKISRDTSVANDFAGTVTVSAYEIIYTSTGFPTSN